ncbi:MAG: hypothetical protein QXU18_11155 [Thermoplasmatales archaeon]
MEVVLMLLLPKLSRFASIKTLIIFLYIIPGFGVILSVFSISVQYFLLILIGFTIFIIAGAGWPPLAVYLKSVSTDKNYSRVLNNSISVPIRIGYVISAVIAFSYLFFMTSLYDLLVYGGVFIIISGLPLLFISRHGGNLSETRLKFRPFLSSAKYSSLGQLHYVFTPFLALFLYHYGFSLYYIGLLMVIRYVGGIVLGMILSELMDKRNSFYALLSVLFLVVSISLLLLDNLALTLIALFLSGIGGPSSNLFYSLFSKTNKGELLDSSSFGITSLLWSSVFILFGGYFLDMGFRILFIFSLIIIVVFLGVVYILLTQKFISQKLHSGF